jgi:hypothetical protein
MSREHSDISGLYQYIEWICASETLDSSELERISDARLVSFVTFARNTLKPGISKLLHVLQRVSTPPTEDPVSAFLEELLRTLTKDVFYTGDARRLKACLLAAREVISGDSASPPRIERGSHDLMVTLNELMTRDIECQDEHLRYLVAAQRQRSDDSFSRFCSFLAERCTSRPLTLKARAVTELFVTFAGDEYSLEDARRLRLAFEAFRQETGSTVRIVY